MSDLVGNHIVGFPTRRLILYTKYNIFTYVSVKLNFISYIYYHVLIHTVLKTNLNKRNHFFSIRLNLFVFILLFIQ